MIENNTIVVKDGYGVSVDDVRRVCHSKKIDVVLLHLEDGEPVRSDADEPDVVKDANGNVLFKSAFYLGRGNNQIPLPAGCTVSPATRPNTDKGRFGPSTTPAAYVKGDLLYGRRPKWQVFSSNNNFGKSIVSNEGYGLYFNVNIFNSPYNIGNTAYPNDTLRKAPNLEQWEGYNENEFIEPFVHFGADELVTEYHNGVLQVCDDRTIHTAVGTVYMDSRQVYREETALTSLSTIAGLGDAVDWWGKRSHQVWRTNNYYEQLKVYGVAVELYNRFKTPFNGQTIEQTNTLAMAMSFETTPLSSSTAADKKAKYRNAFAMDITPVVGFGNFTYNEIIASTDKKVDAAGRVVLLTSNNYSQVADISHLPQNSYADISSVVAEAPLKVIGKIDQSSAGTEKFRLVLDEQVTGGRVLVGNTTGAAYRSDKATYKGGVGVSCYLWDNSSAALINNPSVKAFFELTSTNGTNITNFKRIAKTITVLPSSSWTPSSTTAVTQGLVAMNATGQYITLPNGQLINNAIGGPGNRYSYELPVMITNEEIYGNANTNVPDTTTVKVHIYKSSDAPASFTVTNAMTYNANADGWTLDLGSAHLCIAKYGTSWMIPRNAIEYNAQIQFKNYTSTAYTSYTDLTLNASKYLTVTLKQGSNTTTFQIKEYNYEYTSGTNKCMLIRENRENVGPTGIYGVNQMQVLRFSLGNVSTGADYTVTLAYNG